MVDAERAGIEILEVEIRAMRLQFDCFFRMLNAANESIFDEPGETRSSNYTVNFTDQLFPHPLILFPLLVCTEDDGGLANCNSRSYVVSDNGTFVRSRGV